MPLLHYGHMEKNIVIVFVFELKTIYVIIVQINRLFDKNL